MYGTSCPGEKHLSPNARGETVSTVRTATPGQKLHTGSPRLGHSTSKGRTVKGTKPIITVRRVVPSMRNPCVYRGGPIRNRAKAVSHLRGETASSSSPDTLRMVRSYFALLVMQTFLPTVVNDLVDCRAQAVSGTAKCDRAGLLAASLPRHQPSSLPATPTVRYPKEKLTVRPRLLSR
ncbi:hypothetical protein GWK47_012377 [Chionoecetes opilio]|uniref:Uncharacterized protein n=1 Tax=Chionoecetes opilio TaxID=41210 RepID=A0A8J4Y5J6_CHIOP|nr:hypothetical protein GWK47_012377 [Chionoecetes opilio]